MKKLILSLILLIAASYGFAQNNVTVSGTFTNNGLPKAFELMHVSYHSIDSTTSAVVEDSLFTDVNGFYTLTKNLPFIFSQGYVKVSTTDCKGSVQTKADYFNPIKSACVINFTCPIANCNNSFYHNIDSVNGSVLNVNFSSVNNFGPNASYSWTYGDGTVGTGLYNSHTYAQPGTYNVCLTTTDSTNNCTSVYCDSIFVFNYNFNCNVSFSALQNPSSLTVDFTSYTSGSTSAMLVWDFGDNTIGTGSTVTHTYANSGFYNVCLTMIDSMKRCVSTFCNLVQAGTVVFDPCSAQFKMFLLPDTLAPGSSSIYFSLVNNNPGANGYWSFGDGTTGVGQSIVHSYATAGTYTVMVVVVDTSFQCTDTVYKQILIDGGIMKILGVNDTKSSIEISSAYPNPVNDKLTLTVNSIESQYLTVNVMDITGRVLSSEKVISFIGKNEIEIPTTELNSGMYIVELISATGKSATKFIKN